MKIFFLFLVSSALPISAHAQLTMHVHVPAGTPDSAVVTVAGTFNGWNPRMPGNVLNPAGQNEFEIVLPASLSGSIAFKFTLGSWERVETSASGGEVSNRTLTVPSAPAVYSCTVAGWRNASAAAPRRPTRSRSVSILDTAFSLMEPGRTRRIWLYLPPEYSSSGKKYPVLYMHDGQNLFDEATSFAGEWGVDETLDSLQAKGDDGCIVVGIDNGGQRRMAECSPWPNARYGGGQADVFLDFIVRRLKPYVDTHYRTRPDRLNTAMAGSSLAGNLSLYAVLKFPDIFGRVGIFSPALWFNPELYRFAAMAGPASPGSRLFFVMGAREGDSAADWTENLDAMRQMVDTLGGAGFPVGSVVDTAVSFDGQHAEWFWKREFPGFYRKLFTSRTDVRRSNDVSPVPFDAYVDAGDSTLHVCSLGKEKLPDGSTLEVFDGGRHHMGRLTVLRGEGRLDISGWPSGIYRVQFLGMSRMFAK
jgi:predicted alpha/beta superfamily hydrolase